MIIFTYAASQSNINMVKHSPKSMNGFIAFVIIFGLLSILLLSAFIYSYEKALLAFTCIALFMFILTFILFFTIPDKQFAEFINISTWIFRICICGCLLLLQIILLLKYIY